MSAADDLVVEWTSIRVWMSSNPAGFAHLRLTISNDQGEVQEVNLRPMYCKGNDPAVDAETWTSLVNEAVLAAWGHHFEPM
jgi:hypothetical protein